MKEGCMSHKLRSAWLYSILTIAMSSHGALAQAQDTPVAPPPQPQAPQAPSPEQVPPPPPPLPAAPPEVPPAAAPAPDAQSPAAPTAPAEVAPLDQQVIEVPALPADSELTVGGDADEEEKPKDEMLVTGSRIRRKDLAGPAPVVVFSREQILASGRANVGEFLQSMPEQSNAINRGTNNAGDGSIRVNLRGMGAQSTLVLLNGRRLAPGGLGADVSVDLSAIPTNVIERIEILKDGASAVYGSDAIAGVVNIITKKSYDGAEVSLYGSTTTYGDGSQVDANGIIGAAGKKGSVFVSFGYYNGAPVWAGNRDYSNVQRGLDLSGGGSGMPYGLGSGTVPGSQIKLAAREAGVQNGGAAYNSLVAANPMANAFTRDLRNGQFRAFGGPKLPADGGDGFNFQPYNYVMTPQERFNVFSAGDYHLTKDVRAFFDTFYTNRNSAQTLAPEPLNLDDQSIIVSGQNLYNPFGRDFDAVRRRLLEFNRRSFTQEVHNFHATTGLDGDLPDSWGPLAGWFWEGVFNYNRNESTQLTTGSLRTTRIASAVGPSFVDATGMPRCGSAGSPIDGCVPLNLFGGPGSITQDQVNGLTFTGTQRGVNQIIGAAFNTSGELFHLLAERAVGLALGYEFRALQGATLPDPITAAGETTGSKIQPTAGKYRVHEVYGELSIPIVEKLPALYALELTAAGRGSFYNMFGNTFNYKLGARWAPVEDFAIRGTYSTAFRAPSIPELYQGAADSFAPVQDPCGSGVSPGGALARNCAAAANNGDDRPQIRSRIGGNSALRPETAKIFTLGLVIRPRVVKSLSFTFDYYNTKLDSTIHSLGENVILQSCYPSSDGEAPKYCQYIQRDPNTQRISYITNLNVNAGSEHLDGLDMTGQYDFSAPIGNFSLQTVVTYLHNYDLTLADGTLVKGAGTWDLSSRGVGGSAVGSAGAFPHFRFNAGLSRAHRGFSAGLRTYFIGSFKECGDSSGDLSGSGLCYAPDHKGERWVDAYNTWDLVLNYSFPWSGGRTTVSIGSTNLFNVAPPRVYNGFADTTDTYTYDMIMRQVYARIGHQF
jgi:outer membrane receptor protein involved in Fe transport